MGRGLTALLKSGGKVREDASGTNVSPEIKRSEIGYIWVRFPRTGILAKLWHFFEEKK